MLLDSSAWVEVMEGTEKGREVKEVLEGQESFTSMVTLAEITQWCLRSGRGNVVFHIEKIKQISQILPITETISIAAGELNYHRKRADKKWGMIDSIITATAQVYGLRILTKDNGFRDLPDAQVL